VHVIDGGQDCDLDFREPKNLVGLLVFESEKRRKRRQIRQLGVRMDDGRELSHYATREAAELAVQNWAQKRRSNWYFPLLVGASPSL
jgi:hypothetical protein